MKKRFNCVLIGLGLSLILLGNFATVSLAQSEQELCEDYEVQLKKNGLRIRNVFFAMQIDYDPTTKTLTIEADNSTQRFDIIESKKGVAFRDNACGFKFTAENFEKIPGTFQQYILKTNKKPKIQILLGGVLSYIIEHEGHDRQ